MFQTGGGPPGYFPPDEILDRVATLLGSTGEGLIVMFGGDAEPQIIGNGDGGGVGGSEGVAFGVPDKNEGSPNPILLLDSSLPVVIESPQPKSVNLTSVTDATMITTPTCNEMSRNNIEDGLIKMATPIIPNNKRQFRTGNIFLYYLGF